MSDSSSEMKYCSICDLYFLTKELLQQHLEFSDRHPCCKTCNRSFLNMNSLRNHYVLSARHHYCRVCEKSFKTASGLRMHLEYGSYHYDRNNDPEDFYHSFERFDGWEDELGRLDDEQRRLYPEEVEEFPLEECDGQHQFVSSPIVDVAAIKVRSTPASVLKHRCPICLSATKKISATRCGHIFCTSCIKRVFRDSKACPSCRTPGTANELRKIDLGVY